MKFSWAPRSGENRTYHGNKTCEGHRSMEDPDRTAACCRSMHTTTYINGGGGGDSQTSPSHIPHPEGLSRNIHCDDTWPRLAYDKATSFQHKHSTLRLVSSRAFRRAHTAHTRRTGGHSASSPHALSRRTGLHLWPRNRSLVLRSILGAVPRLRLAE